MASMVPWFVWPVVFGANALVVLLLLLALRASARTRPYARAAGVTLAAWFLLATLLAAAGVFVSGPGRPPAIGLGVFPPIVAGALALAFSRRAREAALAVPQRWLVGVQTVRVLGVVFLVLLSRDVLPPQFALPAGLGDVAVGLAAPAVAYALARRARWAAPLAAAWNALGLLDLAAAVGIGALSAASVLPLPSNVASTGAMAELPLSLIPTFGVPIFVLLHLASLIQLRARLERGDPRDAGAAAAPAR